jgi:hypothetical protein
VTPAPNPIAAALLGVVLALACATASALEPVYWRTRVFYIPYQPASQFASQIDKVQLMVARDGVGQWAVLQEAEPHVRGFSYHAPVDGDYSFALRTIDRKGNVSPTVIAQPQLRVVVDTAPPTLHLNATLDATGRVIVRYDARDIKLKPETLRLEVQSTGGNWERIATGPPDVSQPDRVLGQVAWKPPMAAASLRFRAVIDDLAGNQFTTTADASLVGPLLSPSPTPAAGPSLGSAGGDLAAVTTPTPSSSHYPPAGPAAVEWPTLSAANANSAPPPTQNTYVAADTTTPAAPPLWPQQRTPAQLVADSGASPRSSSASEVSNPFGPPPLLSATPINRSTGSDPRSDLRPLPPINDPFNPTTPSATTDTPPSSEWTATTPAAPAESGVRWVNSLTFDVDYDLQSVGPWGVSKVELWATRDGGGQWVSFGADDDNRSPIRVTVPAAGIYGFRLVVNGANGAAAPTPAAGEQPELVIGVDLEEPSGELQAAEIGQGNLADHLIIRWTAADENLDDRPVGLFYSSEPQGPWSTIATNIDNNGQYAWRLLRQVPEKLFLRLEVRDKAGNVAIRQSPAPVVLNLSQPTGRLRSVRPVEEDKSRFRTAAGSATHAAPQ